MKIATEELRKLADHANERLLRVMPIDADMIAALAAELITARETLEEWKASQHYSYIGADGKTVKARDLEDELITARAKLEAAERLAAAAERLRQLHQKSLRTADYHNASCQCPRCIDDEIVAALTAWDAAQ